MRLLERVLYASGGEFDPASSVYVCLEDRKSGRRYRSDEKATGSGEFVIPDIPAGLYRVLLSYAPDGPWLDLEPEKSAGSQPEYRVPGVDNRD